jgi:hypothetical protein
MAHAELSFIRDEVCLGAATYEAIGYAALEVARFHEVLEDLDELRGETQLPDDPRYYDSVVDRLDRRLRAETVNEQAGVNLAVIIRKCMLRNHSGKPHLSKDNLGFDEVAGFVVVADPDVLEIDIVNMPNVQEENPEDLPTIILYGVASRMIDLGLRRVIRSYRGGTTLPTRIHLAGDERFVLRHFAPAADMPTPDDLGRL